MIARTGFVALALLLAACNQDTSVAKRDAVLEAQPELVDVGTVLVGTTNTASITLTHVSGPDIEIAAVNVVNADGGYFSYDGALPVVPSDGSTTLEVLYVPTAAGYHQAEVTITYNNADNPSETVLVRGHALEGAARARPGLLDYGAVDVGDSSTIDLVLVNEGGVALEIEQVTFTSADFAVGASLPVTLAADDEVSLPVTFTASDLNAVDDRMTVILSGSTTVENIILRANDCEHGDPAVYDADEDGYTVCGDDCDDRDAGVRPGAPEAENNRDDDCDGDVDEGTDSFDDDGDGWSEDDGDCNDGDPSVNPNEFEDLDNGRDDDCDGVVDYGTTDRDADGYSEDGGDCDDSDITVFPGGTELEDGEDNDCDGITDEGTPSYDDDRDGYSEDIGDCDDSDGSTNPAATEVADWEDDDCDGDVDEGTNNADDDGDGFSETGGDCDDANADVSPAAFEVSRNGVDDDCDGITS